MAAGSSAATRFRSCSPMLEIWRGRLSLTCAANGRWCGFAQSSGKSRRKQWPRQPMVTLRLLPITPMSATSPLRSPSWRGLSVPPGGLSPDCSSVAALGSRPPASLPQAAYWRARRWALPCPPSVKAVDGHSSSRGHGQHQIAVGVTNNQVADERDRYGALQCVIPLVFPGPPLGELLHLPSGVAGGHEVHPVGAWGQLVGERVQGGGPGYGCLGRHSDPALDQDHEKVTSLCVPFGRGLPACRVRLGRRIYETR
jgi:hypothetical protein